LVHALVKFSEKKSYKLGVKEGTGVVKAGGKGQEMERSGRFKDRPPPDD